MNSNMLFLKTPEFLMSFGVPLNIQICKTENELFFGSLDLYLAGISLYVIVENHRLSKYIRA